MKVLSLFDGISCGRVALDRARIPVKTYYSSEIDKYAIQISEHNYSNQTRLGDVRDWREWDIPWGEIDLILTGNPCQSYSNSGKQLGFQDPRGKLFYTMLDIMKQVQKHNPNVKFLIENVRMKEEFEKHFTESVVNTLGETHKILINSNLVSAQNRSRYYWTNFIVTQPEDRNVTWGQIREHGVNKHYYSENGLRWLITHSIRKNKLLDIWSNNGKAQMVEASHYKNYSSQRFFGVLDKPTEDIDYVKFSNVTKIDSYDVTIEDDRLVVGEHTFSKTLNGIRDFGVRYITPLECERLQTLPDNYTLVLKDGKQVVSNSQRYKAIGNGWTVDAIAHILKQGLTS